MLDYKHAVFDCFSGSYLFQTFYLLVLFSFPCLHFIFLQYIRIYFNFENTLILRLLIQKLKFNKFILIIVLYILIIMSNAIYYIIAKILQSRHLPKRASAHNHSWFSKERLVFSCSLKIYIHHYIVIGVSCFICKKWPDHIYEICRFFLIKNRCKYCSAHFRQDRGLSHF